MSLFKFDTHMHLDLYKNMEEIIGYIENQRSYTIAVTNLPILYEKYIKTYSKSKYIKFALGFHPELVYQYREQLPILIRNIVNAKYIGEIGLDYTTSDLENIRFQQMTFEAIVNKCKKLGGKVLSIHSRKATKDVNSIIGNKFNGNVIMHWFTGTKTELYQSIANDYFFSLNHHMINTNSGRLIINEIPINKILIESDAPFTINLKSEYNLNFVDEIIKFLVKSRKTNQEAVYAQLKNNFKKLIENT